MKRRLIPYAGQTRRSSDDADRDMLVREYAAAYKAAGLDPNGLGDGGPAAAELRALKARSGPERRDLTGRILGDPAPGRSALDRRLARDAR